MRIPQSGFTGVFRESQLVDVNRGQREAQAISGAVNSLATIPGTVVKGREIQAKKEKDRQDKLDIAADRNFIATREIGFKKANAELERQFEEAFRNDPNNENLKSVFEERANKLRDSFSSGLKRQESKDSFNRLANNQTFRNLEKLESFKTRQLQENILADNLQAIDDIKDISIADPSLESALDSLNQVDTLKVSNTTSLGVANATRNHLKQQKDVADSFVDSNLANEDIGQVKELLKNKRFVEALGPGGVKITRDKIRRLEKIQSDKTKKLQGLKKNKPWQYLQSIGETDGLPPLDFNKPFSFVQRKTFTDDVAKRLDVDVSEVPIRPEEIEGLKTTILETNERDLNGLLSKIDLNVDDETKGAFAKQIFPKQPELGAAIQLAAEDPENSLSILKGFKRIQSKSLEIATGPLDAEIDSQLLNVVEDNQSRNLIKQAIKAHVVESVFSSGGDLKEDVKDEGIVRESIDAILGPQVNFDGGNSVAGKLRSFRDVDGNFLENGEINALFEELTPENIEKYLTDKPVIDDGNEILDISKFSDRLLFQTVGDGRYSVIDTKTGLPIDTKETGSPFVLDLKEFNRNITEDVEFSSKEPQQLSQLQNLGGRN